MIKQSNMSYIQNKLEKSAKGTPLKSKDQFRESMYHQTSSMSGTHTSIPVTSNLSDTKQIYKVHESYDSR